MIFLLTQVSVEDACLCAPIPDLVLVIKKGFAQKFLIIWVKLQRLGSKKHMWYPMQLK